MVIQNSGLRDGDTLNVKITENTVQQVETTSSESSFKLVKEGVVQTPNGFLTLRVIDECILTNKSKKKKLTLNRQWKMIIHVYLDPLVQ